MSVTEEQRQLLMGDLPGDAVRERKGGGGITLSYVDGFYVYNELCKIFGPGGWGYDLDQLIQEVKPYETKTARGTRWKVAYLARVTLWVDGGRTITDVGYGSGIDADQGAAIESAAKEAVTDAVKRCARALGPHMGLALYDKQQRYVSEDSPPPEKTPAKEKKLLPEDVVKTLEQEIDNATSVESMKSKLKPKIVDLKESDPAAYKSLSKRYVARRKKLEEAA